MNLHTASLQSLSLSWLGSRSTSKSSKDSIHSGSQHSSPVAQPLSNPSFFLGHKLQGERSVSKRTDKREGPGPCAPISGKDEDRGRWRICAVVLWNQRGWAGRIQQQGWAVLSFFPVPFANSCPLRTSHFPRNSGLDYVKHCLYLGALSWEWPCRLPAAPPCST